MKKDIHPKYYTDAKTKCACGSEMSLGSTRELTEVEVCSQCHPFFTGNEKVLDAAGRVEKFKMRASKAKKDDKK